MNSLKHNFRFLCKNGRCESDTVGWKWHLNGTTPKMRYTVNTNLYECSSDIFHLKPINDDPKLNRHERNGHKSKTEYHSCKIGLVWKLLICVAFNLDLVSLIDISDDYEQNECFDKNLRKHDHEYATSERYLNVYILTIEIFWFRSEYCFFEPPNMVEKYGNTGYYTLQQTTFFRNGLKYLTSLWKLEKNHSFCATFGCVVEVTNDNVK